jgi:aspartate/methionine/tyrosine aminotransferase
MERSFGVTGLNPDIKAVSSIDSKEAIHKTFLALVEPGHYTLIAEIAEPDYPFYRT